MHHTKKKQMRMAVADCAAVDRTRLLVQLALGLVVVLALAAGLRCVWGVDFWWQWATGRLVAEKGIPHVDVFSYVQQGQPWIELRWGYCLLLFQSIQHLGMGFTVIAKAVLIAASFCLMAWTAAPGRAPLATALVLFLAVMSASQRFFLRPELVTWLMMAVFIAIIHRHRQRGSRLLLLLPLLQVLWTNGHTLFIMGPLLAGLLLFVSVLDLAWHKLRRREPDTGQFKLLLVRAAVFLATLLACFLNPYGWDGVVFPFQLFSQIQGTVFNQVIDEFKSPFAFAHFAALDFYKALIVLCLLSALVNIKRLDPFWTLLVVSQFYLSALAIRNLPLFALAAIPFVVDNFARGSLHAWPSFHRYQKRAGDLLAIALVGASLVTIWLMATDRFNVYQNDTNQFGIGQARHRYPERAARFLLDLKLDGPVFHTLSEGSYLLAHGQRVFADPRLEVYGESVFSEYLHIQMDVAAWRTAQEKYGFTSVLAGLSSTLTSMLLSEPGWTLAYFDEVAAVFVRGSELPPLDVSARLAELRRELPVVAGRARGGLLQRQLSPTPYLQVADLLRQLGQSGAALAFLDDARACYAGVPQLHLRYGLIYAAAGDTAKALPELESALAEEPDNPVIAYEAAIQYANAKRYGPARGLMEKGLAHLPDRAAGWALLGKIDATEGRPQPALEHFSRAVALDPNNSAYRHSHARLLYALKRYDEAGAEFRALQAGGFADPIIYRDLAACSAAQGHWAEARDYVDQGLAISPQNAALLQMKQQLPAAPGAR